jgi:hypothetical protein
MGDLGVISKARILIGMRTIKTVLIRFQIAIRTLLGIGLKAMCATFWQTTHQHFVPVLILCVRLSLSMIDLMREITKTVLH